MAIERRLTVGLNREILTPKFYNKCVEHIERMSEPLLLELDTADHTLFAAPCELLGKVSYSLKFDQPEDDEFPAMLDWTWEQFFRAKGYSPDDFVELIMEQLSSDFEDQDWMDEEDKEPETDRIKRAEKLLGEPADQEFLWDEYKHWGSPEAQAYYHLFDLELEVPEESFDAVGLLRFIDSPSLGYYACSVEVEDPVSLSLLQARLIELGKRTKIEVIGAEW